MMQIQVQAIHSGWELAFKLKRLPKNIETMRWWPELDMYLAILTAFFHLFAYLLSWEPRSLEKEASIFPGFMYRMWPTLFILWQIILQNFKESWLIFHLLITIPMTLCIRQWEKSKIEDAISPFQQRCFNLQWANFLVSSCKVKECILWDCSKKGSSFNTKI